MKPRAKKGDVGLRWRWLDLAGRAIDVGGAGAFAGDPPVRLLVDIASPLRAAARP